MVCSAAAQPSFDGSELPTNFTMDHKTGAYTFGYDTGGGEHQSYRVESRSPEGAITGYYGFIDPKGILRIVSYVANQQGYRAMVTAHYPVSHWRSTSVIGPVPSAIFQRKSKPKK